MHQVPSFWQGSASENCSFLQNNDWSLASPSNPSPFTPSVPQMLVNLHNMSTSLTFITWGRFVIRKKLQIQCPNSICPKEGILQKSYISRSLDCNQSASFATSFIVVHQSNFHILNQRNLTFSNPGDLT